MEKIDEDATSSHFGVEVDPAAVLVFYSSCRTVRLYIPVKDKRGSVPVKSGCKEAPLFSCTSHRPRTSPPGVQRGGFG